MPQRKRTDMKILVLTEALPLHSSIVHSLVELEYQLKKCSSVEEMCAELEGGGDLAIIEKIYLDGVGVSRMVSALSRQPAWSRPDLIVLLPEGEEIDPEAKAFAALETHANLNLLEYPHKREDFFTR